MAVFHIETKVYKLVDETYKIEADSAEKAVELFNEGGGTLVSEDILDSDYTNTKAVELEKITI